MAARRGGALSGVSSAAAAARRMRGRIAAPTMMLAAPASSDRRDSLMPILITTILHRGLLAPRRAVGHRRYECAGRGKVIAEARSIGAAAARQRGRANSAMLKGVGRTLIGRDRGAGPEIRRYQRI